MKNFENNTTLKLRMTRKLLLLTVVASIAFSSCNTYPGLFSCLFKSKIAKKQSFCDVKSLLVASAVVIAGCFAGWALGLGFKGLFGKKEEPVPAPAPVEENFAQKRVKALITASTEKKILKAKAKIEIVCDGANVINNVYQLEVDRQSTNSCGPRALFNSNVLSKIFESKDGVFIVSDSDISNVLTDLNNLPGALENKNLRLFFNKIFSEKIVSSVSGSDCDSSEPINLNSESLEKIIKTKAFEIKETTVIDGCDSIDWNAKEGTMANGFLEGPFRRVEVDGEYVDYYEGTAVKRDIGYFHSFIIKEGVSELSAVAGGFGKDVINSLGHWFAICAIKTGENEYSWFIFDSLNKSYLENGNIDRRISAPIEKLLGSMDTKYKEKAKKDFEDIKSCVEDLFDKNKSKDQEKFEITAKFADHIRKECKIEDKTKLGSDVISGWLLKKKALITPEIKGIAKEEKDALNVKIDKLVQIFS